MRFPLLTFRLSITLQEPKAFARIQIAVFSFLYQCVIRRPHAGQRCHMKVIRFITLVAIVSLTMAPAACATSPKISQTAMDYSTLLTKLRASGASVKEGEKVRQNLFSVEGRSVLLDGSDIQAFEYPTAAEMETASARVSPDGFTFTVGNMVSTESWIAPPHFYKSGRIIVVYIGSDNKTTASLESVLGKQFAGL